MLSVFCTEFIKLRAKMDQTNTTSTKFIWVLHNIFMDQILVQQSIKVPGFFICFAGKQEKTCQINHSVFKLSHCKIVVLYLIGVSYISYLTQLRTGQSENHQKLKEL